jgi:hypothetical protein
MDGGNINGLKPTGLNTTDLNTRKIMKQAQSKFHETQDGSPSGTDTTGYSGEIKVDDTNKRLLVRCSDGWYALNMYKLT